MGANYFFQKQSLALIQILKTDPRIAVQSLVHEILLVKDKNVTFHSITDLSKKIAVEILKKNN